MVFGTAFHLRATYPSPRKYRPFISWRLIRCNSVCLSLAEQNLACLLEDAAVTASTSVALPISVLVGFGVEYYSPFATVHKWSEIPIEALFVGGTSGPFLVFAAVLWLVSSGTPGTQVLLRALYWSPLGGVLAAVGWNVGPWLGMALWSLRHGLNLTLPGDRFEDALAQGRSGIESMLLVWQTGMGLYLAWQ